MKPVFSQCLRVVHSSAGRLRVFLPDPGGQVTARLRCLPGVTSAEAGKFTGNILILFNARKTSEKTLLDVLRSYHPAVPGQDVKQPETLAVSVRQQAPRPARPVVYLTGVRASLYKLFGWASVGMAVVGAILPGIPTVPFVLLAGYFFIRSSPKSHEWLLRSRWFGPLLRDWQERRGVRRSVKYAVVGLLVFGLAIAWVLGLSPVAVASISIFGLIGVVLILRLPEVEATASLAIETQAPALAHTSGQ